MILVGVIPIAQAYDSRHPVVCLDEQPVQLIGETRVAVPATKTHAKRVDYEYERRGTASIFMVAEPLGGFRTAAAHQVGQGIGSGAPVRYAVWEW